MKNIYLVGMMGSGKTSTARELGALLQVPVVDLDAELEKQMGQTISKIFQDRGEEWFREQESSLLVVQSKQSNCIVATGGGVILRRQNRDLMRNTGKIVFLDASFDVLWKRVSHEKGRPLLGDVEPEQKLMLIWHARQPVYEECSDLKIMTDDRTPKQVAREIQEKLRERD